MSHVYAIEGVGTGLIKLGRAADPRERLRQLQTGSPVSLRLLCAAPEEGHNEESALHRRYAAVRRHGEWFELFDDEAAAAILGFGECVIGECR